jgi:hypothetical protein
VRGHISWAVAASFPSCGQASTVCLPDVANTRPSLSPHSTLIQPSFNTRSCTFEPRSIVALVPVSGCYSGVANPRSPTLDRRRHANKTDQDDGKVHSSTTRTTLNTSADTLRHPISTCVQPIAEARFGSIPSDAGRQLLPHIRSRPSALVSTATSSTTGSTLAVAVTYLHLSPLSFVSRLVRRSLGADAPPSIAPHIHRQAAQRARYMRHTKQELVRHTTTPQWGRRRQLG